MIGEYKPVDFTTVKRVELVGYDDPDFVRWKEQVYKSKPTESQIRRREEIGKYPEFFDRIKNIFINSRKTCEFCHHRRNDSYNDNCFICWKKHNTEYPNRPGKIELNEYACENFCYCIPKENQKELEDIDKPDHIFLRFNTSNAIQYYLYDLGLWKKENLKKIVIGENAKALEKSFKEKIKNISDVEIIEKIFKIFYNDGHINFKLPDVIFKNIDKHSIIEYKADFGDIQQLIDYQKLFIMATGEKPFLYWVMNNCWCIDDMRKRYENDELKVFKENEFLNYYGLHTGISAWQ